MYDEYDDFYEDYSEYNDLIYELKEALKKEVKDEIIQEMERLKKENEELADIKANWDAKVQELENKKYEYEIAKSQAEDNAKRVRFKELIKPFVKEAWGIHDDWVYAYPKCDKCDNKRHIHFTSPSGKDCMEDCKCSRKIRRSEPIAAKIVEIDNSNEYRGIKVYFQFTNYDSDYGISRTTNIYEGQDFSEIDRYSDIVFFNKEDCQKYCDYLNQIERDKLEK